MLLILCAVPVAPRRPPPNAHPALCGARRQTLYLVETDGTPAEPRRALLGRLLGGARPWPDAARHPPEPSPRLVAPRAGCISPWSSKATELLRQAGLTEVRRIERIEAWFPKSAPDPAPPDRLLYDPLTEQLLDDPQQLETLFQAGTPAPLRRYPLDGDTAGGRAALVAACLELGITLAEEELEALLEGWSRDAHAPSDVELMMYAQVNSEHCRHKIFNGRWRLDGAPLEHSPFAWIRSTCPPARSDVLSAYRDNAAVRLGVRAHLWYPDPEHRYRTHEEQALLLAKVETHNHPTGVCPYPGAATGAGGELRDEAAVGRGARPLAGLTGYCVSDLQLPDWPRPWEEHRPRPPQLADALRIMLEAPLGACDYNNEFGRPNLCGFFRTFERHTPGETTHGYYKPIMLAGGCGIIRTTQVHKRPLQPGDLLVVLGGPGMRIGLGGGSASSTASGRQAAELDFASVQRDNAELQRRCQEVIDRCWALGEQNPILALHDVGAGGLSNALPELVRGCGAELDLAAIPSADPGMGALELWCNEAQERYVLALRGTETLEHFRRICERERAPWALFGQVTHEPRLRAAYRHAENCDKDRSNAAPIDMPMAMLFPDTPGRPVEARTRPPATEPREAPRQWLEQLDLEEAAERVLHAPAVAAKTFLITIGDRGVGGLTARDQLVGPWQLPVADCAVSSAGFQDTAGFAMAVGERCPAALLDPGAAARLAVCEALTNLCAARVLHLQQVMLSGNWMAAADHPEENADLYRAVRALAEYCRALEVPIPVGKDSLSMRALWEENGQQREAAAPISAIVSAFAPAADVEQTLTPMLQGAPGESVLLHADLGLGHRRLGGSTLEQVFKRPLGAPADAPPPEVTAHFFRTVQLLNESGLLLAYHDCSDGGPFVTLCEMAWTARRGLEVDLDDAHPVPAQLFAEEPGAVLEVRRADLEQVQKLFQDPHAAPLRPLAAPIETPEIRIRTKQNEVARFDLYRLLEAWSETSLRFRALRDDPRCAQEERHALLNRADPGLRATLPAAPPQGTPRAPAAGGARPRVAILREQGVNGHAELAAAFHHAGFQCMDVHTSDLLEDRFDLHDCHGLAAPGGFSYGDVLGAGTGWAAPILHRPKLRELFRSFFAREDRFSLGICNGCQMLARLRTLIPGAAHWPLPLPNRSGRFEARLVMVEVPPSPSIFLRPLQGAKLPIVAAHAEGRLSLPAGPEAIPALHYLDAQDHPAEQYPANPNGSEQGLAGFSSLDGRATILMPHPERVFLNRQLSWRPPTLNGHESPWAQIFHSARRWLEQG